VGSCATNSSQRITTGTGQSGAARSFTSSDIVHRGFPMRGSRSYRHIALGPRQAVVLVGIEVFVQIDAGQNVRTELLKNSAGPRLSCHPRPSGHGTCQPLRGSRQSTIAL